MKEKKPLSPAQLEQRRAAGRARAAKFTPEEQSRFGKISASKRTGEDYARAGRAGMQAHIAKAG
ncbi:MAG: hypothetical protein WCS37_10395 [Chloroflexota bacterium]